MTTPPQPMSRERLAHLEATGPLSAADQGELIAELKRAREYGDDQYMEADYWRESYRLTKGLSHDEIGARIAARDASKPHPRPCRFPHQVCTCRDAW